MENLTFSTWAHSQFNSFVLAMVNALVNYGQEDLSDYDDIHDLAGSVSEDFSYDCYDDDHPVHVNTYGSYVVTINKYARKIGLLNTRNGKFVETYCNKKDEFDIFIGLGVLWAKYNHIERPKIMVRKKLSEVKPHEIFRWGCNRYEFIGSADNRRKDGKKYIILRLHDDTICQFYEDMVMVEE